MRRAVDGLLSVVTLETTLPLLKDVTVTFLTAGFFAVVATLRVAVGEVLRVLVLRALGAVTDLEADDLTGMKTKFVCLPSYYKHKKTPVGVLCATLSSGLMIA